MDRIKVMIIDTDMNLIEDLQKRFLLEPNFEPLESAISGSDGFAKIRQYNPNIIIASNVLPDTEITSYVNNLNMSFPNTCKIITLEMEDYMVATQLTQMGVSDIITKPYTSDRLIEAAKTAFNRVNNNSIVANKMHSVSANLYGGFEQHQQQQPYPQMPFPQNPGYQQPGCPNPTQMNPNQPYNGNMGQPYPAQQPYLAQQPFPEPRYDNNFQGGGMVDNFQGMSGQGQGGNSSGYKTIKKTVIAFYSAKGGVGKSTLSKDLALAYSRAKINGEALRVVLVDCNLQFGNVKTMFRVNNSRNISHWVADINQRLKSGVNQTNIRYSQDEIKNYLVEHNGLNLLLAPNDQMQAISLEPDKVDIVIKNIIDNGNFDVIVLDLGNNTDDHSLLSVEKADVILFPVTLDVTAIGDTASLLKTLAITGLSKEKMKIVINKMPKNRKDLDVDEIKRYLNIPIIATIPDFPDIRVINNSGQCAIDAGNSSGINEYRDSILTLADKIVPVFGKQLNKKRSKQTKEKKFKMFNPFRK